MIKATEENKRAIAEAVQQAIATHLPNSGAHYCSVYAAVGSIVIAEAFDRRCVPVIGGLILDGPGNTLFHWIPSSPDFESTGKYHCWIECPNADPQTPGRTMHIDLSARHDEAYNKPRRHGHLGGRPRRQQYIWGWADEVRISLQDLAVNGHIPRGKTLVLPDYPATAGWMENYLQKNRDAIVRIAGKALQQLKKE